MAGEGKSLCNTYLNQFLIRLRDSIGSIGVIVSWAAVKLFLTFRQCFKNT
ncbi:hypothetical protein BATMR_32970 [Bacillus altitudinis]|nr:hypothetical protein BATMR_32970 [Bacillus altitudinis]